MMKLSIRRLITLLILAGALVGLTYSFAGYYYLKEATEKAIKMESVNRAYVVTKQMSGLYDYISTTYVDREEDVFTSLQEARRYLHEHGRDTSLEVLKQKLMRERNGSVYDIYLINSDYIIDATTYADDLGLDFKKLPNAYAVLLENFNDPKQIDISPILHSGSDQNMRRYIAQQSIDGSYLVQLGQSLDKKALNQQKIVAMQHYLPNLMNSETYQIFGMERAPLEVERWWMMEHHDMKVEVTLQVQTIENFDLQMKKMLDLPEKFSTRMERFSYFKEAFQTQDYMERYFWRDGRYVHWIVMPLYTRFNHYSTSLNILVMEFDETASQETIELMNFWVVLLWLFLGLMVAASAWLIQVRVVSVLLHLQKKMQKHENVSLASLPNLKDEVGSIARVYDQLLDDLHREIYSNKVLLAEFKTFAGNAIHQIRTPLSVIKIALEMAECKNEESEQQIKASLVSIEHMYDTLSYMVQHEKVEYLSEKIDLSALFKKRIDIFNVVALAHDISFNINIEPNLHVMMNQTEAEYLIDNNLSNAIKFSQAGSTVTLTLRDSGSEAMLSFLNYGQAIKDVASVFKRHVREDESRSGSGIGLNMVDTICKRNNILIQVDYVNEQNQFSYFIESM